MKKLIIILSIIILVIGSGIFYYKITSIKLFEGIDTNDVAGLDISNVGTEYKIHDKEKILEIMNYLKGITLRKTNDTRPNTSSDTVIALEDKNGKPIGSIVIYGNVSKLYPKDKEQYYNVPASIYDDIDELCKKDK